ncbi:hypothetical protein MAPG_10750 [Magnaporthiopsis poae ATCC 64411]|uniref:Uncharacterized protein n=1 Tax=Magnaporthiopsis poae (strain ATCC 64411 / 73-15) TaxID=644358 RepID=A0A0C4EDF2_MAGP6|nr:hypothetical protein MAPG_10750 [Magnaporthiopsis poae ATCC 64411]
MVPGQVTLNRVSSGLGDGDDWLKHPTKTADELTPRGSRLERQGPGGSAALDERQSAGTTRSWRVDGAGRLA